MAVSSVMLLALRPLFFAASAGESAISSGPACLAECACCGAAFTLLRDFPLLGTGGAGGGVASSLAAAGGTGSYSHAAYFYGGRGAYLGTVTGTEADEGATRMSATESSAAAVKESRIKFSTTSCIDPS